MIFFYVCIDVILHLKMFYFIEDISLEKIESIKIDAYYLQNEHR